MNNNLNLIGEQADRIDSVISGLSLPLSAELHLEMIKSILPEISEKIKSAIVAETGENPWE